jgi:hypothetical protein
MTALYHKSGIIFEMNDPHSSNPRVGRLYWLPEVEEELGLLLKEVSKNHHIDPSLRRLDDSPLKNRVHPNHKNFGIQHNSALCLFHLLGDYQVIE